MTTPRTPYRDLHHLPEWARIAEIGRMAKTKIVGVLLDNEPDKIARYIAEVVEQFPEVQHLDTTPGPVARVVTVRFCPKASN